MEKFNSKTDVTAIRKSAGEEREIGERERESERERERERED